MEKDKRTPEASWSEAEFSQALACALARGREDYVSILYLCRRAGLRFSECLALTAEGAAQAVREQRLTYIGADGAPRTIALDSLLTARLKRDLIGAAPGWALYLAPGQKAEEAERELWRFIRDYSTTWEEGERDD